MDVMVCMVTRACKFELSTIALDIFPLCVFKVKENVERKSDTAITQLVFE